MPASHPTPQDARTLPLNVVSVSLHELLITPRHNKRINCIYNQGMWGAGTYLKAELFDHVVQTM
jgi:hypothetical protein